MLYINEITGITEKKIEDIYCKYLRNLIKNQKPLYDVLLSRDLNLNFTYTGVVAGYAFWEIDTIEINRQLMERDPSFFEQTFGHELAHIITNRIEQRNCGHNDLWVHVCKMLETSYATNHSYDTDDFRLPDQICYYYKCNCRTNKVSLEKHRQLQASKAICNDCGKEAVYTGETPVGKLAVIL